MDPLCEALEWLNNHEKTNTTMKYYHQVRPVAFGFDDEYFDAQSRNINYIRHRLIGEEAHVNVELIREALSILQRAALGSQFIAQQKFECASLSSMLASVCSRIQDAIGPHIVTNNKSATAQEG